MHRASRGYDVPSKLSEADKLDLQEYITRCNGSLTTFKNKDEFRAADSGHTERLRNTISLAVELQTRVSTSKVTGAAIIENGEITKSKSEK